MKAFIFPGQGAQFQGMVKDFCLNDEQLMNRVIQAEKISEKPVSKILWETELSELSRSDNSQLAITVASIVLIHALKSKGIESDGNPTTFDVTVNASSLYASIGFDLLPISNASPNAVGIIIKSHLSNALLNSLINAPWIAFAFL